MATANQKNTAPVVLVPNFDKIPVLLRNQPRWIVWKVGKPKPGGRYDKIPLNHQTEKAHDAHDPSIWLSFDGVSAAYASGKFAGIGFVLDGKPISKDVNGCDLYLTGIDIDKCIQTGSDGKQIISIDAKEDLLALGQPYIEFSPSKTGIRAFMLSRVLFPSRNINKHEVYCDKRYLTITGHSTGREISEGTDALVPIYERWFPIKQEDGSGNECGLSMNEAAIWPVDHNFAHTPENVKRIKLGLATRTKGNGYNGYDKWNNTKFEMRTLYTLAGWPEEEVWKIFDAWSKWVNEGEAHYDADGNRKSWDAPERVGGSLRTFASILQDAKPTPPSLAPPVNISGISAADLATKIFAPLNWVVDGVLPEGSYLLSARPKVGKSWLALQICLAVAHGDKLWSKPVQQGVAIYLALEENQRRLQKRLGQLRVDWSTPHLLLYTEWKRSDQGGLDDLEQLLVDKKPRLVVIDTLAKIRAPSGKSGSAYEGDYNALAPITAMAGKYSCCIVIVTHNRKGKAEGDATEMVSGTLGQMGAVDGALVIDGNRGDATMKLTLVGRDIEEDGEFAIKKLPTGGWDWLGKADEVFISQERKAIIDLLKVRGALKPKDISDALGKHPGTIRKLLSTMLAEMQVNVDNGGYYASH